MPSITVTDLSNAKTDVDHIAAIATSLSDTATDRLGNTKKTMAGAIAAITAITDKGAWVTATAYAVKDVVTSGGFRYICIVAHTSGAAFADDLSTKWRPYENLSSQWCGTAGGTANALTLTPTSAIAAYADGQQFIFEASANNTGATTVGVSGLTATEIKISGAALSGGEIVSGGLYRITKSGSIFELDITGALLAASTGASLVGTIAPETGGAARTQQDKNSDSKHVFDFFTSAEIADAKTASPAIVTRSKIQKAIDTGLNLDFGNFTYNLGDLSSADLTALVVSGKSVTYRGNPTFIVNTTDVSTPIVFAFDDFSGVALVGVWKFRDTGFDRSTKRGARAIALRSTDQNSIGFVFDRIEAQDMVAALLCGQQNPSYRVKGIIGKSIYVKHCYYGVNCAENGDHLRIQSIVSDDVNRGYFVYGIDDHVVDYESNNHTTGGFRDVYIQAQNGNTSRIKLRMTVKNSNSDENHIAILNQSQTPGLYAIRDIDIEYNDVDSTNTNTSSIVIESQTPSGSTETTASNTFENITIRGRSKNRLTFNSAVANQCLLKVDKDIFNPLGGLYSTKGFLVDMGDGLFYQLFGNLNTITVDFAATDAKLFMRRFKMLLIDDQSVFTSASYKHLLVQGVIRGSNANGTPVTIDATVEYDKTTVGAPGTYTVGANGENIHFSFSGWSGGSNGVARVWIEKG